MTVRRTNRWRGIVAVTLVAIATGVLAKRPLVLLTGIVGIAFALYPRLVGPASVDLSLDRRVSDDAPAPGDDVEVTVTLTHVGERSLWDVRIIDGVPSMLPVIDGTARRDRKSVV